jgi:hypothetical protein
MNATKIIFFMAALLIAVTMSAFGQQGAASTRSGGQNDKSVSVQGVQNPRQPGRSGSMSAIKREEVRKKIAAVKIWRLTEALKLDANTSAKLSSLLSAIARQRRDIHREKTGAISFLRFTVRSPKPDSAKLKTYLDKLEKYHRAMHALTNREMRGLKNILTIEQQARYVVFQHEFTREMRGMIGGAHGNYGKSGRGYSGGSGRGGGLGQTGQ